MRVAGDVDKPQGADVSQNDLAAVSDWSLEGRPHGIAIAYPVAGAPLQSDAIEQLRVACMEASSESRVPEFRLAYMGLTFRVRREVTQTGTMFFLRRFGHADRLRTSRVPEDTIKQLISRNLSEGGLVLVSGVTGAGKTSTVVSALVSRLLLHGGVAWTIEDPAEFSLEGPHGNRGGTCWQKTVEQGSFAQAMRDVMRCYPAGERGMLFVGEVRDGETADECLKAASNGLLVIATIHAGSITGTLDRITGLAETGGDKSLVLNTLASHLRLIVHQGRNPKDMTQVQFESLWIEPNSRCTTAIRDGDFQSVRNDISFQANRRKAGKSVC